MKPEIVGPNKDVMTLLKLIVEQHARIIEANSEIMRSFTHSPVLYKHFPEIHPDEIAKIAQIGKVAS